MVRMVAPAYKEDTGMTWMPTYLKASTSWPKLMQHPRFLRPRAKNHKVPEAELAEALKMCPFLRPQTVQFSVSSEFFLAQTRHVHCTCNSLSKWLRPSVLAMS